MNGKSKLSLFLTASTLSAAIALAQAVPPLINYQGRLTDATGAPVAPGVYGLQVRLWDSPTASNTNDLIWGQQYGNVFVTSNGVFNLILGAPGGTPISGTSPQVNNLSYAFANSNCFLGVTIAAQFGTNITSPSEILPRQQLLSVPYAFTAATASVALSVTPGSISSVSLAAGSIQSTNLGNGIVTLSNLAPRMVITNSTPQSPAQVGSVAISPSGSYHSGSAGSVSGMFVTITTSGRPVFVGLMADGQNDSSINVFQQTGTTPNYITCTFALRRDNSTICSHSLNTVSGNPGYAGSTVPSSSLHAVDLPPGPGTYTYSVVVSPGPSSGGSVNNAKLFAFEL